VAITASGVILAGRISEIVKAQLDVSFVEWKKQLEVRPTSF
jgi:hypothetical protein